MANATQYLDENYPSSNRSLVTNLDISNKNFVGNLIISGFVNLQKLNYSFNNFDGSITFDDDSLKIEDIDSSFVNTFGKHWYDMGKLKKLNLSNNQISELDLDGSSNLAYLYCHDNSFRELNLNNSVKYVEVNCSNNPTLSKINLPEIFVPVLFDCRNTTLDQVPFSNSSVFDCQKNTILPQNTTTSNNTTTTTSNNPVTVTATPTTYNNPDTATATPTTNNNLGLKIGLSVVGIIAIFLLGLVTFLCYRRRIRKKGTSTSILQIANDRDR
ncbi:hypothetical protein Glove_680g18 [Diversispora epigaea]|uniref:Uncharacterized protein n=1 Tax=Diversispora epigaea TaxID=1348612 RepID=A0A397G7S1_9GLOM|nr:hypothetical protein Glove_680g18 [Diversispora epigaea]